ncbi:hypothetical protein VUR80DRAFT_6332 [Thermomyces stellatus]
MTCLECGCARGNLHAAAPVSVAGIIFYNFAILSSQSPQFRVPHIFPFTRASALSLLPSVLDGLGVSARYLHLVPLRSFNYIQVVRSFAFCVRITECTGSYFHTITP